MYRVDFLHPLTALEIREPLVAACQSVAFAEGLYAKFLQPQQKVWADDEKRTRIGRGTHKSWSVDIQADPPATARPHIVGTLIISSLIDLTSNLYGGFDYGKHGELHPEYGHIDLGTPDEINAFQRQKHMPDALMDATVAAIAGTFKDLRIRLF